MEKYLLALGSGVLVFLIQLLWTKTIKDFTYSNKICISIGLVFAIITSAFLIITEDKALPIACISVIIMILTNLSIIDCKYYEISGDSYWFLIPPVILYAISNGMYPAWACLISGLLTLGIMMLTDKIIGIEKIGGADVKLMLITALMFSYYEILIYMLFIFASDIIIFIISFMVNKIKTGKNTTRVPMIVAINMAVVALFVCTKFFLY